MFQPTLGGLRSHTISIFALAALILLSSAIPVWAQQTEWVDGQEAMSNEVLVRFKPTTSSSQPTDAVILKAARLQRIQALAQEDADASVGIGGAGVVRIHSRSKGTAALVRELKARPDVLYAEPNYLIHLDAVPNDPSAGSLWGLKNTGQVINNVAGTPGADISAVAAWDISTGSRANVVAVVDTGIDYNHPDLAANVWSAPTAYTLTIGGVAVNFRAGSHGYNAITNSDDPFDDNRHGSHVSGTIGAVGNNGLGVVGVNWTASIMGCKFLDSTGSGTTAGAINAIEYAIQVKAKFGAGANVRVLSNSWGGGGFSQALLDEINKANTADMLFVAAAGNASANNDTTPNYPSNYNTPNMVAVAATTNTDALASFSNYGSTNVHLGAPGQDILSTVPGSSYAFFSGTSMATPHVSGAAALILSKVNLNTAALKSVLLNNVDPISSLTGRTVTGGRLNVNKAIRAAAPAAPDFSLSASPASQTVVQGAGASYSVTVTPSGGFTGSVTLSATGLPAGATAVFSPNPTTANSTLSVTTSPTTPAGSYPLTLSGASASLTHTTTVTLIVQALAPPTNLTAAAGNTTATLTWTASQLASTYSIRRSTTTGGPYATVKTGVSGTTYTDTGLVNGTTYYYVVTAVNMTGESANSNEASAKPFVGAVYQINAAGGAVGTFAADNYFTGGGTYNPGIAVSVAGVANAAPAACYGTERWGSYPFSYAFPNLTPGTAYKVRLHFTELYYNSAGNRLFNVAINGAAALSNFDIFAAAGVKNKAVVRDFSTTADSAGKINIVFTTVKDSASLCAIEIFAP